jgi:hypothetical protein
MTIHQYDQGSTKQDPTLAAACSQKAALEAPMLEVRESPIPPARAAGNLDAPGPEPDLRATVRATEGANAAPAPQGTTQEGVPTTVPPGLASAPDAGARVGLGATLPPGSPRPAPVRSNRYALLAICAALSACIGAIGGSAAIASLEHVFSWSASNRAEPPDELRPIKDAVGQLRAHMKAVGDNVAALRANFISSTSAANAQLVKISEQVDKVERAQADRRTTSAVPDITSTLAADKAGVPAKPAVVEGWVVRRVFDGAALVESRHGVLEVEPGDNLPGIGRIQEIKRQDGRWVVVTAKGLIMPVR